MNNLALPPIDLDTLKPRTRDWLLARAATDGVSPQEVLLNALDRRADQEGYGGNHHDPRKHVTATDIISGAVAANRDPDGRAARACGHDITHPEGQN